MTIVLSIHWIVPFVLTAPQFFVEFSFDSINGSDNGGVGLYWKDEYWQVSKYCMKNDMKINGYSFFDCKSQYTVLVSLL